MAEHRGPRGVGKMYSWPVDAELSADALESQAARIAAIEAQIEAFREAAARAIGGK